MKFDLSMAYRRFHYHHISALQSIAVAEGIGIAQQRLTFGGAACPAVCCPVTELIADLTNDILDNSAWSPDIIQSQDQHLVPQPLRLEDNINITAALPTMLLPNPKPNGTTDVFIDDLIVLFLDREEICKRAPSALPLAINILERPVNTNEIVPRSGLLALNKLEAE